MKISDAICETELYLARVKPSIFEILLVNFDACWSSKLAHKAAQA